MEQPRTTESATPLLTAEQVSERLAINVREVLRLARSKRLPSILISPRLRRFRPEQVEEFLTANTQARDMPGPQTLRKRSEPPKASKKSESSGALTHSDYVKAVRALIRD